MNAPTPVPSASRAARVQQIVTPGGIEAWLVEDYAVPMVAFDFAFKAGATNDPAGRMGATSMMSALLDEGAGSFDADAFHRALDEKAVELSFRAGYDAINGDLKTLSRYVDDAFEFLRLSLSQPRFGEDAIERVRSQTIAGLRHEANDPDAVAGKTWRQAAFPGHPYGLPAGGDLASVAAITRADIASMHAALMARDNLRIAAVGAIDAKRLSALIDKAFADVPAESNAQPVAPVIPVSGARHVADIDVPQTTLRISLPGISRHDRDFVPAVVLNHIFGGGSFSSRLFQEVREKRGLAYSVWTQLQNYGQSELLSGGTSTKNERALESLQVIEEQMNLLLKDGPTPDELEKAKKYLIGSYALRFDTSTKIAGNLVSMQVDGYPVEYLDQRNGMIAAVTMDDINRAAKRLFEGKSFLVAAAGRPVGL